MKIIIIFFLFLTVYHETSTFALLEFISEKINNLSSMLTDAVKSVKDKIKNLISRKLVIDIIGYSETRHKNQPNDKSIATDKPRKKYNHTEDLSTSPQLAALDGNGVESHTVLTKDGYLLTLHRIKPFTSYTYNHSNTDNKTVLLHHGLLGSSVDWIILGEEKSLPYMLSRRGYDVWMANARGNYYSRSHVSRNVTSTQFWKFTWQEIGQFDLPAVIDYIRKFKSTNEPINYVGHSMGSSVLLVLLSVLPEYNKYLRIGILLAPLAFMEHAVGPLKMLALIAMNPPEQVLQLMGKGEFLPLRKIPKWISLKYCQGSYIYCSNPLFFIIGENLQYNTWNASYFEHVFYHTPAGTSSDTILHYAQLINTGKFHRYSNLKAEFPLREITLPIVLFSSTDDKLATISDVLKLYLNLANPVDNYVIRGKNISHTDFVWGAEADTIVFSKIIEFLDNIISEENVEMNRALAKHENQLIIKK